MTSAVAPQWRGAGTAKIGFEARAEVQPGGHFFATAHTMERYAKAFCALVNADLSNLGAREDAGAQAADVRATALWQKTLPIMYNLNPALPSQTGSPATLKKRPNQGRTAA